MKRKRVVAGLMILSFSVSLILSGCKKNDEYRLVKVEQFSGTVTVDRDGHNDKLEAFEGMKLISNDVVDVDSSSDLKLLVDSDKHLMAEENTSFELVATGDENKGAVKISMTKGSALFEIENKLNEDSTFEVSTPNAVFSVRGTEFKINYDENNKETTLEVYKGVVAVDYSNGNDQEEVNAGEGKKISEDNVENISVELSNPNSNGGSADVSGWTNVDSNDESIKAAYRNVIADVPGFISGEESLNKDYLVYDYMIYDYNQDNREEIILYLEYKENDVYYRDVVFLFYNEERHDIGIKAINKKEENDSTFYAEWENKMVRYSWRTSPYESYIYSVQINEDNNLCYVLEAGYDEIFSDPASVGMRPLPLYGNWEIPFLN